MKLKLAVVLLLALLVSACGWQLRGAGAVSLDGVPVALVSQVNLPEVERALRNGLERAGAVIVEDTADAEAVVVVLAEQSSRRAQAVDRDARVQEYELEYGLRFRVDGPDGEVWAPPQVVTAARGYRYDDQDVLGTEAREEAVRDELRGDVARLMQARVQAAIGNRL